MSTGNSFKRYSLIVSCIILTIFVISISLLAVIVQIITFPFTSPEFFYHINCYIAFTIWRSLNFILFKVNGSPPSIDISFEGFPNGVNQNEIPEKESAIIVSNHISATDFYVIHAAALRRGMLGQIRYFLKDSIKWIPIYGLGMWFLGMIYVKRSWTLDKNNIKKQLAGFSYSTKKCFPIWIVTFAEGSRITPSKLKEAQEFCKEKGVSYIPSHTLVPRSKGFCAVLDEFRESSEVKFIYDFTIAYWHPIHGWGVPPSLADINFGLVPPGCKFYAHVKRIPISDIPQGQEEAWLKDLFIEKDQRLGNIKAKWMPIN